MSFLMLLSPSISRSYIIRAGCSRSPASASLRFRHISTPLTLPCHGAEFATLQVDGTQGKLPTNMSLCRYNNEVSNCTGNFLLPSYSRPFMAGSYIWSGFDYDVDGSTSGASATATGMLADRVGFEKPLAWCVAASDLYSYDSL